MNLDELKQVWQAQAPAGRLTIDAAQLLREVRRNEKHFRHGIFWRDVREVGVALLLTGYFLYSGIQSQDWTLCVLAAACLWVGVFMVVDRRIQRQKQPGSDDSLLACLENSLRQVNHQIWLLKNVLWWYLMPPSVALVLTYGRAIWRTRDSSGGMWLLLGLFAGTALLYWGVYWLNQFAVRRNLEPRRQELISLQQSLIAANNVSPGVATPPVEAAPANQARDTRILVKFRKLGLWIVLLCVLLLAFLISDCRSHWPMGHFGSVNSKPAFCPLVGDESVTQLLKPIREKFNVPAMAAAVVTSDGLKWVGAVGVRKRGTEVPVGLNDLWHLGSDGKVMTSTLIARLVEQGKLRWDSTLGEIFPDLATNMNPEFRQATLLELLSHRAGLPPNANWNRYRDENAPAERLRVVRDELARAPQSEPGSKFEYSNLGYVIAGAVVEKVTGKPWEEAISSEVFKPLHMDSAGFGGLGTPGKIDQPWPHFADGSPAPENGASMDNPPVMGPAGRIHCAIQDWAKFIQDQLRGARGESGTLLKPESYQRLQKPPFGGDYALGWNVVQRSWGGGTVFCHQGDNTMNYANVWVAPKKDFAILVCVNQSGDTAFQASDAAVGAMIGLVNRQDQSK